MTAAPSAPEHLPRLVRGGLVLPESPRWHHGALWYAEWGSLEVVALATDGSRRVAARSSAFPFSFDWMPGGGLVVIDGSRLLRYDPGGRVAVHANLDGLSAQPWNELTVDARGNAYVDNLGFDFPHGEPYAPGMIALVTPDGKARIVADDLSLPNAMVLTPSGDTLVVAETVGHRLTAFTVAPNGDLTDRRIWADLGDGTPDGICLDDDGAIWYADTANRRCVRVVEHGAVLDSVALDREPFACALGGPDGRTLYIAAAVWAGVDGMRSRPFSGQLLAVPAPAPRAGRP